MKDVTIEQQSWITCTARCSGPCLGMCAAGIATGPTALAVVTSAMYFTNYYLS